MGERIVVDDGSMVKKTLKLSYKEYNNYFSNDVKREGDIPDDPENLKMEVLAVLIHIRSFVDALRFPPDMVREYVDKLFFSDLAMFDENGDIVDYEDDNENEGELSESMNISKTVQDDGAFENFKQKFNESEYFGRKVFQLYLESMVD